MLISFSSLCISRLVLFGDDRDDLFPPFPSFLLESSGYICISLPKSRLDELDIPMMVAHNQEANKTAYTVTVDYKHRSFLALPFSSSSPWPKPHVA